MGVRRSGFRITALPVASAGETARMLRMSGKLNGDITPTTPCGTRRAILRRSPLPGSTMPCGSVGMADDWCSIPAAMCNSTSALGETAPVSRMIHSANSGPFSSMMRQLYGKRSIASHTARPPISPAPRRRCGPKQQRPPRRPGRRSKGADLSLSPILPKFRLPPHSTTRRRLARARPLRPIFCFLWQS